MKPREFLYLLPGYELDGFPRSLPGPEADDLLSGWVALWHPALIATAGAIPRWQQASQLPSELDGVVAVVPSISNEQFEPASVERLAAEGGLCVRPTAPWTQFQDELLGQLEIDRCHEGIAPAEPSGDDASTPAAAVTAATASRLRADFAALGYAYLQIQLMTRQLRYSSNLDLLTFSHQAIEAAEAAVRDDSETAERMLQACFDSLGQERDHYYSLDLALIDVTLLAETTLGKSLMQQLDTPRSTNYLASASLLRQLTERHATSAEALQRGLQSRTACIVGGLDIERPHPLMTHHAVIRDLRRGRDAYQALGFEAPQIFGRLSFGLTPDSAAALRRVGYAGCMLTAWAGGAYPEGSQSKISWEASDGTFLPSIAAPVLDASSPGSFLSLGVTVGESLDHQHVPTLVLAHWPSRGCDYYELLQIIAARTPALGRWMLADDYFNDTDQPYHQERLSVPHFRFNWLSEAESPRELIEATKLFHALQVRGRSLQNLANLAWQLEHFHRKPAAATAQGSDMPTQAAENEATAENQALAEDEVPAQSYSDIDWAAFCPQLAQLWDLADGLLDAPASRSRVDSQADDLAEAIRRELFPRLAKQLARSKPADSAAGSVARLLLNPRSAPVRTRTRTEAKHSFETTAAWHFADGRVGEEHVTCIDLPSLGFVIAPADKAGPGARKQRTLADAGGLLTNEFLEAQIDSSRGHLRSLHIPERRGNRLSLMIALRQRSGSEYQYSEMVAGQVEMLTSSNVCGLIRATGRLEFAGEKSGKFEIDYRVWRGNRVLEIDIRLFELPPLPEANPWRTAYVARLAWPMEAAMLRSFSCGGRHPWPSGKAISPLLIEIDETDYRTHYLTGGLAFHRRMESRFLETVLAVQGDEAVHHRIGIGVDLPHPHQTAAEFVDNRYEVDLAELPAAGGQSGWLATVDTKNVLVNLELPLVDKRGHTVGVRLRLTETDGKSTNARVRLLREIESASRVDFLGGMIGKLTAEEDRLTIALRAGEHAAVDVLWKQV